MSGKTVVLWCREPSFCKGIPASPFGDAVSLVPLYCFDPRERGCFQDPYQFEKYHNMVLDSVLSLRNDLQTRNSNLLVVNGNYEKMIPSIARVLGASEVVTFNFPETPFLLNTTLQSFKSQSLNDVSFNLGMHSIAFRTVDPPSDNSNGLPVFPPFPRINPGSIPTAA